MQDQPSRGLGAANREGHGDHPQFVPTIDMHDVFRQLVADELRCGRLTPARRRRIMGYAAQLGLSAVQAGRLVEACRKEALESHDPKERYHALRLVEPPSARIATPFKIALVIIAAIVLDLLILQWL
jgi:hypothetical protein